jgi:hypothetical protein
MIDLQLLLENEYKTDFPELLEPYAIDIEWESSSCESWSGKIYQENTEDGHYPMCAVENTGTGAQNNYYPIVFNQFPIFKKIATKCFPTALEPLDYACMYLEIRDAYRQQDLDSQY